MRVQKSVEHLRYVISYRGRSGGHNGYMLGLRKNVYCKCMWTDFWPIVEKPHVQVKFPCIVDFHAYTINHPIFSTCVRRYLRSSKILKILLE